MRVRRAASLSPIAAGLNERNIPMARRLADGVGRARAYTATEQHPSIMLTEANRTELARLGAPNVRMKLQSHGGSRNSALNGFLSTSLFVTRGDVEDWLTEQAPNEAAQQHATLNWAKIAGWAAIGGMIFAAISAILAAIQLWVSWPRL